MSVVFIWVATALYAGQLALFVVCRNWSGAAIVGGYAVANLGLISQLGGFK